MADYTEQLPGFQGSGHSSMAVIVYPHKDDPLIVPPDGDAYRMDGRKASDRNPSLLSVQTSKIMGSNAGTFSFTVKPSRENLNLFSQLVDDSWVDIVMYKHDQPYHIMRGMIDEIRRTKAVAGSGATTRAFTITGRDFSKVWEITPIWFSPYATNDLTTDAVTRKVFKAIPEIKGSPAESTEAYLKLFLEEIANAKGPNWEMPRGMPNITTDSFIDSITFQKDYFQNEPPRKAFNPNFFSPQGTLWQMAMQFVDPMFVELYSDLLPAGDPFSERLSAGDSLPIGDLDMTVVIRDKPFPVISNDVGLFVDTWDRVPVITIPIQQIKNDDLGRGGLERYNAFFTATRLLQDNMGPHAPYMLQPLINTAEIRRHGIRRLDIQSNHLPDNFDSVTMAFAQRRILRDWYALNPYLLSGTLALGVGRPDAKIGCKARVPGVTSEYEDETYYIEGVSHSWNFGATAKTALQVTRGWVGSDASYLDALAKVNADYIDPEMLKDLEAGS